MFFSLLIINMKWNYKIWGERYTEVMWQIVLSMKVQSHFIEGIGSRKEESSGSKAVPLQTFPLMFHFVLSADNLHFENIELRALVVQGSYLERLVVLCWLT